MDGTQEDFEFAKDRVHQPMNGLIGDNVLGSREEEREALDHGTGTLGHMGQLQGQRVLAFTLEVEGRAHMGFKKGSREGF